jgi:hypothetical protein
MLERGRRTLGEAREEYSALGRVETVPDRLVEAIVDLERELDELDQTLEVTDEDVELAERTVQRVSLLEAVLSALRERQRTVVEADVRRLDYHVSGIVDLVRDRDLADEIDTDIDELEREYSMLERLVEGERYRQVETNDRVSTEGVDAAARQVAVEIEDEVPPTARAEAYLDICDRLLDDIHDALSGLGEDNDERTAHTADLRAVKERTEVAESALESDDGERAATNAHVAFDGCLILHYLSARASARQRVAEELAAAVRKFDLVVDCDIDRSVDRGDAETLLAAILDAVESQVEVSTGERIRQLLAEHDGSVVRTAETTDFDVATIVDHLEQLYRERHVSDIRVEFANEY